MRTDRRSGLLLGTLLAAGALITAFPFLWMVLTAFKPAPETRKFPPTVLPDRPTLDAFVRLFRDQPFATYLVNTLAVVAFGLLGMLLMAMAGYALAKMRFRGRQVLFFAVLSTLMIPVQVTMIPTYLLLNRVHLTGTLPGIALPTMVSAFSIFLFRQFMLTIPDEILDAARVDGASEWRLFWAIVLPLSRPIIAVVTVLTFIAGWNSFLWPLILGNGQDKYTLSVGLSLLNQQLTVDPPLQMAGACLMVAPIVLVFLVFQRHIVHGFTMSGLK